MTDGEMQLFDLHLNWYDMSPTSLNPPLTRPDERPKFSKNV